MTATMHEVIERFRALQEFDLKILRLEKELARAPAALKKYQDSIAGVDAKIKAVDDRAQILRAQIKLRENELKSKEQKIQRLKEQSSEVRSNKEFVAFRSEIANAQGEADRLQGEVLKILDVVEQAQAKVAELNAERQRHVDRVESAQKEIDTRLASVKAERDGLLTERPAYVEGLPEEQLAAYERARGARGTGMASLEGGYCANCGDMLTRNDVYAVQNRTRIVLCRACNCILFQP